MADLMEAACAWLVQTILATLLIDKIDAWIRQVGLADDIEKLKSEIRRIKIVLLTVKERGIGNTVLTEYLALLQDHLYEADDVVDELDYYRLQQQVQGVTVDDPQGVSAAEQPDDTSRGNADMPLDDTSSSRGVKKRKKWSKAWENFNVTEEDQNGKPLIATFKHCLTPIKCAAKDGTSGMLNHNKVCQKKPGANDQPPNPSSAGDATETTTPIVVADSSGRKRRREDEEAAQVTIAGTYTPWDKAELSNRIQNITSQLQDVRGEVSYVLKLHGSDLASSSNHHLNTASDQHLRTSSLLSRKVYGRVAEKISIKKLILEHKSDGVRVLPIVGIAGVGKTALAQLVYNDPEVETYFQHRIWVWVSRNFDEVRLTREMLDFVSQERHEGISSFAKLQEILKSHANSKRLLIIFDDVWDDMKNCRWDKLLAPFIAGQGTGVVVVVTTRSLSVVKRLGTLKPVKLGALEHGDFLLLFKSCAFGDADYEFPSKLSTTGLKIAEKLKGNPLAAVSIAALLKEHLTVDHWSNILQKEDWKSLELVEGIMPALKLSYDQLSYHLQQCFSYCSIFPNNYKFFGKDLVYIWISQGFVNITCLTKSLEEAGWEYLTVLVNLGFFQQIEQEEEEESSLGSQNWYSMCDIMHDLAKIISRNECATIDSLQCNKILPTIRHLSIVTDSAYNSKYRQKFEENLRNIVPVSKLRTLVLLGLYNSFFLQLLQDILQKARNLRLLQMSATCADFYSLMCSLVNPAHLRYLKCEPDGLDGALPLVLIKFFHLQVLDVSNTDPIVSDAMHRLVCMRHLVAEKGVYSKIANIGSMTSLQELEFKVHLSSSGFEITQLRFMNGLVQLGLSQLNSVRTREEANQARLYTSPQELLSMDGSGPSSEATTETAREVLQGLEPHLNLKHLHISGYNGTTSPTWISSNMSLTSLQTLHLDGCGGWRILPPLESFPFLTKLKLISMQEVTDVLFPSLEELVLIEMPKLKRCSSTSVEGLSSSLRVLQIEHCEALKEFDLFDNDDRLKRQGSWLPGLRKLILRECPRLKVLNPLPPSATCFEFLVVGVSTFPAMEGSSSEKLHVLSDVKKEDTCSDFDKEEDGDEDINEHSDEFWKLDDKILAFHNLRNVKSVIIQGFENLSSFSLEGFSQLVSLKSLEISSCKQLFSSDVMPEHTTEDVITVNWKAFPSLEYLSIESCGIAGKCLSLLLRHAPHLEELNVYDILSMEEEGDSSSGEQDDALTGLAQYGLVHMPLNLMSSLKKISIILCSRLTFNWSEEGFSGFTSLQEVTIGECPELFASLVRKYGNDDQANRRLLLPTSLGELNFIGRCFQETLQPCFPSDFTNLKRLTVDSVLYLESLQLHSCTALEELTMRCCESLTALEGLQSLGSFRHLAVYSCTGLRPCLERFSRQGCELLHRLETLESDDPSVLTTSFCNYLTSLRRLKLQGLVLTEEQGRALLLLTSLQELEFRHCSDMVDLPAGLQLLHSLERLKIFRCQGISRLLETRLPLSLEELEINFCRKELADQCRLLATRKLNVKIYYSIY